MSDYSELERLAEANESSGSGWYLAGDVTYDRQGYSMLNVSHKLDTDYVIAASPAAVLALIAENKRVVALNHQQFGMALQKNREIDQLKAENERLAALLECAQGDLKQAMQIIEKDSKPLDDLIAENEALCSKIANMNASGFGEAFYLVAERLGVTGARPVSPMQVFTSEVLPALDKAIKDAERYRWLRDQKPNSLNLGRNSDHSSNYMKASEWIEQNPEWFDGTPEADLAAMADTDTIWQLQIYPNTPVGFNVFCRATLDDLIDSAMSEESEAVDLPANCWEITVPKGSFEHCHFCLGAGTVGTGIDESPSTICSACDGTGMAGKESEK